MSQAARSWSNWTISAFVVLVLAGCGGTWHATFEEHGIGKDEYWVVHGGLRCAWTGVRLSELSNDTQEARTAPVDVEHGARGTAGGTR